MTRTTADSRARCHLGIHNGTVSNQIAFLIGHGDNRFVSTVGVGSHLRHRRRVDDCRDLVSGFIDRPRSLEASIFSGMLFGGSRRAGAGGPRSVSRYRYQRVNAPPLSYRQDRPPTFDEGPLSRRESTPVGFTTRTDVRGSERTSVLVGPSTARISTGHSSTGP